MRIDHDPIRPRGTDWLGARCGSIFSGEHDHCEYALLTKDQCAIDRMPVVDIRGALGRDFRFAKAPTASKFAPGEFVIFSAAIWSTDIAR